MREAFKEWSPNRPSFELLEYIADILNNYREQGYRLTLRQLYYQLVSRDRIANSVKEYTRIGNIVSRARLAGYIDWDDIEDRVRVPKSRSHWDDPSEILRASARSYYRSRWDDQDDYLEVWCEKDAVSNILEPVCREWDVTFLANRGYSSQSAMYEGYRRLEEAQALDKRILILYFGDHDPSGVDMTRDIEDRLGLFLYHMEDPFKGVDRVALNMDQVDEYGPPENPAKMSDSRFQSYVEVYGPSSWELDALEPKVLAGLVADKITERIDMEKWEAVVEKEDWHKLQLQKIADETIWDEEEDGE